MLKIEHVSKTYNQGHKEALKDVSLTIGPGEFTALLGQNGAGKSTLINIMAGNVKKSSGTRSRSAAMIWINKSWKQKNYRYSSAGDRL